MTSASEIRSRARQSLSGKWGIAILAMIVYAILNSIAGVTGFGAIIFSGPLTLGLAIFFLKIVRKTPAQIDTVFEGFGNFLSSFILYILSAILIALWTLLFIIPGIIKAFSYSMSYYIMADNPEMSASEAIKESMQMMSGNKWRLFCLGFSFIGWILLGMITFGIAMLWVAPYIQAATAEFYEDIKNNYTSKQLMQNN